MSSPNRSPPRLTKSSDFPGDARRLVQAFGFCKASLSNLERTRLSWLTLVSPVAEHSARARWDECDKNRREIESLVQSWTSSLEHSKSSTVPHWSESGRLGVFAPILYRSFDFYEFVLDEAVAKFNATLSAHTSVPEWLEARRSVCRRMMQAEWESELVSFDQRKRALLALRTAGEVSRSVISPALLATPADLSHWAEAEPKEELDAVIEAAGTCPQVQVRPFSTFGRQTLRQVLPSFSNPGSSQRSLAHGVPIGYRKEAIYFGSRE
ncbi:hypothetical protein JCM11491_006312 [Sporobolomyces phaffii]